MISDYDIMGTMFLGVSPLNLYILDLEIGPGGSISTCLSGSTEIGGESREMQVC